MVVQAGDRFRQLADGQYEISPTSHEDYARVIEAARQIGTSLRGVVHLWSLDQSPADRDGASLWERHVPACESALYLVQSLLAAELPAAPLVAGDPRGAGTQRKSALPGSAARRPRARTP